VPTRHLLVVHVLAGAGVVPTITVMDRFVRAEHDKGPGSVSPHLYHRSADVNSSHQVTEHGDGTTRVIVTGTLATAFDALGLIEE
ncbi:MAG: hypothetical protein L0G99_16220, partial [Propionibacteriales bacterium]|nr:hypothetical protein [Propionibacteriales bacterium]